MTDVSYAQHLGTFLKVYPPPPIHRTGTPNVFIYSPTEEWPLTDKLKHPNLSPDKLSVPPWRTTASGLKFYIIFFNTGRVIAIND